MVFTYELNYVLAPAMPESDILADIVSLVLACALLERAAHGRQTGTVFIESSTEQ